ncbi:S-type anion channel SLAH2-like isoform X1 [Triticum dicoccoides]|uniref:S-type anion channel SLAH2-like isoform X1 n=1 Tax=Triticum dicoccoides TaxID=85692 RepID=UPI00188E0328|nr:S-type anion channel SLAH2-like isoform X1 [Triticum dicoccoides]
MASREVSIQMAWVLNGQPWCAPSPEPLLLRVPSRAAGISSMEAADAVVSGGRTTKEAAAASYAETSSSVLISVPGSPSGLHLAQLGVPPFVRANETGVDAPAVPPSESTVQRAHYPAVPQLLKQARHHSQPSLVVRGGGEVPAVPRSDSSRERDRRFDHFKTFSGRLERQLSSVHRVPQDTDVEKGAASKISEEDTDEDDAVPTSDRYFAALEGPELETLRPTEVAVLPKDETWPFLLRFPISAFGMCLGVSSQAMLWKTLESEPSTKFLHVHPAANHVLWWISVTLMVVVSITYLLKVVFYFEAVRREFHHPVRVNFFFAPSIACLFLVKGVPHPVWEIHHVVWYLLMLPILCLDLKIYGQWMSSGERRLSKVANPSNHLAVVGNFVGALLGARMGLRELPIFFFGVGLAHYAVLFVTLYQRLPTNVQLPKELHPVFFLFVAAPSVASMAWARISGEFNDGAKLLYFISLFLYVSLVVRVNLFRGFRFSLAWWAYTFPMTSVALATVLYASEVDNVLTRSLVVVLSGIAVVTVTGVLVTTMYHAFLRKDLFPNDVSIAITRRKPKFSKILAHLRSSSSDVKELVLSIPNLSSSFKQGAYCNDASSNYKTSGGVGESPVAHRLGRAKC